MADTVDARAWLGLEPTHNPLRWYLPVVPGISTGGGFLFGGCGLGAAIAALEGATGRPVVWATAQYLSYAQPGTIMDLDVTVAVDGRHTTQARVVGRVAEREILTVNAALGARPFPESAQWVTMPPVAPPGESPRRESRWRTGDSIMDRLDQRWALHDPAAGHVAVWSRMPDLLEVSAPALAVLGDYVPLGLSQSLTVEAGANSLDNTLRVVAVVPTEWVLVDVQADAVVGGFGHGTVHLWAEDGTLLATASQSAIVRAFRGERPPRPAPPTLPAAGS